jgi:hypothetical protein
MEGYYRDRDLDDLYSGRRRLTERAAFDREPPLVVGETRLPEKRVIRAVEKEQEEPIEPLRRMTPEVVGSLFDRVKFLKTRIEETGKSMEVRDSLHKEMIREIEDDIKEKMQMEMRAADVDEKRNLKLDISALRKEKRTEHIRFWKDMMELRTELRELLERFETESKISRLFTDITR